VTATRVADVRRPVFAPLVAGGILLSGCVALAIVDPTHGPTICPFKAVTGLDCPGCGGTRAAHKLLTGHVFAALSYNALAVVLLPFLAWGLFASLVRSMGGPTLPVAGLNRRWATVGFAIVIAFTVLRNLPIAPFSWLGTGT
jgi:Protein of unknown function (DUF2752)